eukprot:scaffold126974_cov32-Tisochrysis_lutea.AAC.3
MMRSFVPTEGRRATSEHEMAVKPSHGVSSPSSRSTSVPSSSVPRLARTTSACEKEQQRIDQLAGRLALNHGHVGRAGERDELTHYRTETIADLPRGGRARVKALVGCVGAEDKEEP